MMLSSLRARLLASYVVVLCVCLALVTLALLLVARPLQERWMRVRLSTQAAVVAPIVRSSIEQGRSSSLVILQVASRASDREKRILFLERQGKVLVDSANQWTGQEFGQSAADTLWEESRFTWRGLGPDGRDWVYAALPTGLQSAGQPAWVVLVALAPRKWGGIALILSVLLSLWISSSVSRPMHRMSQVAEAIAAGEYDHEMDFKQPDELRILAQSMLKMSRQVKTSQQAIRDLVINVSHDLKTPLTSIQGFSQSLLDGVASDKAARDRAASVIYDESTRMARMVDQLVDLARIDSGQLALSLHPLDLTALLREVATTLSSSGINKGVRLHLDLPGLPTVLGDSDRLKQVFTNVVDNGLKYTPSGGHVQITARRQVIEKRAESRSSRTHGQTMAPKDWVAVHVSDTGCGIPYQDQSRVFERFYRVDRARVS